MLIIPDIDSAFARPCAIALGTFDGVHLGHRAVISAAVAFARAEGLTAAVFTFSDLPKNAFLPEERRIKPLCSQEEKALLFEELGVELVYSPAFAPELYTLPAERFVREVLIERLMARHIVCGHDHRFGAGGRGDTRLLMDVCREAGCAVTVLPPVTHGGVRVSSTAIRALLEQGRVEEAQVLLGRSLRGQNGAGI